MEQRAAKADLKGSTVMTGYRADVRALLPADDLYASSSIREGVSTTILEAVAAGLPVVAPAVGGTPEVLRNGAGGTLVPARAPEKLAAAILALGKDPGRPATPRTAPRGRLAH